MKIVLSGVTGFIGKNLIKSLLDKKYDVFCIVRDTTDTSNIDPRAKIYEYDNNITSLIEYFLKEKFEGVIHLASSFVVNHKSDNISELITTNIKFSTELLEASKQSNVKWFINTGTFWQHYETNGYNPVNLYASTKEAFESIAKYYTETSSLVFVTIKLNDTFGANDTRDKIFNLWSKIAKSKEELKMSKGEQIIDISYINDVVNAYAVMINNLSQLDYEKYRNQTYVVSNNQKISLKELSKIFEKCIKQKLNILWGELPYRDREVMQPFSDGKTVPNWTQKFTLAQAIKKTIQETK